MSICRDICELVDTLLEDFEECFDGTCLARHAADPEQDKETPEPGDIIGVDRGLYRHYGIYAGDDTVIHYTAEHTDIDPENAEIQETSLERFLRDETEFFILDDLPAIGDTDPDHADNEEECTGFDADETVTRARSRLGERRYNLLTNNCEHFVVWCKTGISDSRQVRNWVDLCRRILMTE